jgi:hypothetical protein
MRVLIHHDLQSLIEVRHVSGLGTGVNLVARGFITNHFAVHILET